MGLRKRWEFSPTIGTLGLWVLRDNGRHPTNRAYIDPADAKGYYALHVWEHREWHLYTQSKNLRTLKSIGRIAAAARLEHDV